MQTGAIMFTFFTQGFLFFLAACSIPIIIHLLFRRRYQRIRWAAMQFLLAAYRTTKTNVLLENLILLILRILVVLVLVLIFARPMIKSTSSISSATQKNNFIFVLDNSYSMGLRGNNTSCFEKAKSQGKLILEQIQNNDTISIILMSHIIETREKSANSNNTKNGNGNHNDSNNLLNGAISVDVKKEFFEINSEKKRQDILKFWEDLKLSESSADIPTSLENLHDLVRNTEYTNKRVFIFSDFQKNSWERAIKTSRYVEILRSIQKQSAAFTFVDVGIPDPQNIGIVSFDYDGVISTNVPGRFIAKVSNYGTKSCQDVSITFFLDGQKQKTEYFTIGPKQEQEISFYTTFVQPGNHYVTVELSPDNLIADNIRHISLEILEKIRVLVVDGDPKTETFASETDYFLAALGDSSTNIVEVTKVAFTELGPKIVLKDYDVVVLANLADLKYFLGTEFNRQTILENFVKNGGGLWIWLGDKVSADSYNEDFFNFRELLPGRLNQPIGNIELDKNFTTYTIDHLETHRVWRYFFENPKLMEDIKNCFIYKYFHVEVPKDEEISVINTNSVQPVTPTPENSKNIKILATYRPGNHPAILERKLGKGKVILSTTTLDREWNNFHTDQYGHVFVIMIGEFLQYLVGHPYEFNNVQIQTPFSKDYDFYVEPENVNIITPLEETKIPQWKPLKALDKSLSSTLSKDVYRMYYSDTNKSGVYRLRLSVSNQILQERPELMKLAVAEAQESASKSRRQLQEYFVVNVESEEGNIQCYNQSELTQQLATVEIKYEKNMEQEIKKTSQKDMEYWKNLALILLLMTLLETFLAMWFGKYNK